jgi:hypothetical protein
MLWSSRYNLFRKLEDGELLLVKSFVTLEEGKTILALFDETWPGEYYSKS